MARKKPQQTKQASVKIDAASINARVPMMSAEAVIGQWQRCLEMLADEKYRSHIGEIIEIVDFIEFTWSLRSSDTPLEWRQWDLKMPAGISKTDDAVTVPGMLGILGYRVGVSGLPALQRRYLLDKILVSVLPPAFPPSYMTIWGQPDTSQRLRQMAISIAGFCKIRLRALGNKPDTATGDWIADLQYLKQTHHRGRWKFKWPTTTVRIED